MIINQVYDFIATTTRPAKAVFKDYCKGIKVLFKIVINLNIAIFVKRDKKSRRK
jgi:hypothetical protein